MEFNSAFKGLMSHRACCYTCYTIQLMHYSHFKTHSLQHSNLSVELHYIRPGLNLLAPSSMPVLYFWSLPFFSWPDSPSGLPSPHCWGFEITLSHTTSGKTPLDGWTACCRGHYLTYNTLTRDRHPCPGGNRTPQSPQASWRRPTPQTAQRLGSAFPLINNSK